MGHVHITDFNVAIHYSERRLHTSVAGSMAYMAPEVIGHKGYTWFVDWWSLGVVAWELLFHKRPFDGRTADKMKHSIMKDPLRLPSKANELCSAAGQDALRGVSATPPPGVCLARVSADHLPGQFLDRNPKTRLGCRGKGRDIPDVREHPWFASIDWDVLEQKDAQPPFVPDVGRRRVASITGYTDRLHHRSARPISTCRMSSMSF